MKSTREEKPTARLLEYAGNCRYLAISDIRLEVGTSQPSSSGSGGS